MNYNVTYPEIIESITTRIATYFDQVYHSAEIIQTDSGRIPTVVFNNEWMDLSPADTKETIYIRRNGDDESNGELKIGSCARAYQMRTPLRIVYFRDHTDKHNEILAYLMQAVLTTNVKLNRIVQDKWKLQKDESSGDYSFGPKTAYFALDIYALWTLQPDTCEQDYCISLENPVKQCPVTLSESGS